MQSRTFKFSFLAVACLVAVAALLFGHVIAPDTIGIGSLAMAAVIGVEGRELTPAIKHVLSQFQVRQEDYAGTTPMHQVPWEDLVASRDRLVKAGKQILDKIAEAKSAEDVRRLEDAWDYNDLMIGHISKEMDKRTELGHRGPRNLRSGRPGSGGTVVDKHDGPRFRNLVTGEEIRGLRVNESARAGFSRIADAHPEPVGRFGDLVGSIVRGRPVTPEIEQEFRTMSIGTPGNGGYAVPYGYAMQFIDLARAESQVMKAGAITIPMETNILDIARITGDPTPEWKDENDTSTASDVTIDRVRFTARTVRALVKGSQELFMDSPNIGQIIDTALSQSMGLEMDRVALVGSGVAPEPQGIYGASNVLTAAVGGTPQNYDFVSRAVEAVRTQNFNPNAMIAHPRTYGTLDRLKDGQNQPLTPPRSFADLRHYATTSVPVNLEAGASPNDTSLAFVGKWDELLIGKRMDMQMIVSNTAGDGITNALANYQIMILVVARMDVQLARPKAFHVSTGIND